MFVLAGGASPADAEDLAMALQGFDVEDDGSSEWQALVDMFDLCAAALTGLPPDQLSDKGVRLLLEAAFTQVTNQESEVRGRPLFQPEAEEFVVTSLVWERACDFVRSV